MADTLAHRGPDDSGTWCDAAAGVAFGHRRLAILDLSAAGHQPMKSRSGRYVLAFNGEIYNHQVLREELESERTGHAWGGHSDTETLLAAFEAWGIEESLTRSVGMFAIAVWDTDEQVLTLARDRFGEKPLYYGWVGTGFVFSSELKALRAYPSFTNTVCQTALAQYLRFMYVPAPRSIYRGIYKVEPGCLIRVARTAPQTAPSEPLRPGTHYGSISVRRWWSLASTVERGAALPVLRIDEARELLELKLNEAVRLQSLSDVPLGAFLSGGVDSSTIVALMQKQSARPIRTFTIGFEDKAFDEAPFARQVAAYLGTAHTEHVVTAAEARSVIPLLPTIYDEPFADSSQIPTYLVSRVARRDVAVSLSGDAGDELFGGYNRYFWGPAVWNKISWMPYGLRAKVGRAMTAVPTGIWDSAGTAWNGLRGRTAGIQRLGDKAHRLGTRLRHVRHVDDLYASLVTEWPQPADVLSLSPLEWREGPSPLADPLPVAGVNDPRLSMMYRDSVTYLPDDILCKVDRAAMAVSLETRVPMLDHRVVELAWRLPASMKIRSGQGKWILREVLYGHVPRSLIERPKAGFGIPLGDWLRGPLREWAESLLNREALERSGYLAPEVVRTIWQQHLQGNRDWTHRLWSVLMFEAWLEANR